jgi:chromosome segregation ATPase
MKKILNILWMLVLCFCVGTVLAQMLIGAMVLPKLKLNDERLSQIAALAQGNDIAPKEEIKAAPTLEAEQASYQEIVESRAAKYRNLEMREKQLRNNFVQVQSEESKLADDIKRAKQLSDNFKTEVTKVRDDATSAGMDDLLQTLLNIKPKLAQEMLLKMLDDKRIDDVVTLLKQMPPKKRGTIIGEFKTPEDKDKLSEVLLRLREGQPEIKVVDKAQANLEPKNPP